LIYNTNVNLKENIIALGEKRYKEIKIDFSKKIRNQIILIKLTHFKGRAIAQAVSRWLPTAAARVRARVWQVGFVVDKVALG
jgi:hypothetical protein